MKKNKRHTAGVEDPVVGEEESRGSHESSATGARSIGDVAEGSDGRRSFHEAQESRLTQRPRGRVRSQQRLPTTTSQAMVVINQWEPQDQFLRGRGPAFITTFGVRWHPFSNCPRLSQRTSPLV